MSKVAITGNASGTGTFTIASPDSNSDRTLNLPDNSGTLLSNASTAGFPAGSVLQVVNANFSTEVLSTTTTFADTGLTASITPTSASSKVLVLVNHSGVGKQGGDTRVRIRLLRNSTDILLIENNAGWTASSAFNRIGSSSTSFLDSPATTSSVTYKTQFSLADGSGTVGLQFDSSRSTITLMEIAA
jgi:hypothetical protein